MKQTGGLKVRRMIEKATEGTHPGFTVSPLFRRLPPRLYDDRTDFADLTGRYGIYIIYATRWRRGTRLGSSRIQYIGRGHLGPRLRSHLEKIGLARLAQTAEIKFIAFEVNDEQSEFVFESILLNEHKELFDGLPKFNRARGSSSMFGWRSVIRMSPGPRAILSRYGGRL